VLVLKIRKENWAQQCTSVVPATQEDEAGGLLESWNLRPACITQ
jgi:hypothetical protein